jgi:hypothetical protein
MSSGRHLTVVIASASMFLVGGCGGTPHPPSVVVSSNTSLPGAASPPADSPTAVVRITSTLTVSGGDLVGTADCNETDWTAAVYTEKGDTETVDRLLASAVLKFSTFRASTDADGSPTELCVYGAEVALPVIAGRYGFFADGASFVLPPKIFEAQATPEHPTGLHGTWRTLDQAKNGVDL